MTDNFAELIEMHKVLYEGNRNCTKMYDFVTKLLALHNNAAFDDDRHLLDDYFTYEFLGDFNLSWLELRGIRERYPKRSDWERNTLMELSDKTARAFEQERAAIRKKEKKEKEELEERIRRVRNSGGSRVE